MRTIRLVKCRAVYMIHALVFMFFILATIWWYLTQPLVRVSKAVMSHQQEARASVLHYYNPSKAPYLVMVTAMEDLHDLDAIYNNTLHNYFRLMPTFQPILYVTNYTRLSGRRLRQSKAAGWMVREEAKHINGLPVIKHMILDAMKTVPDASYYGYSNPDMLFDEGLVFTLKEITMNTSHKDPLFAVGREIVANVHGIKKLYIPSVLRQVSYNILLNLADDIQLDFFVASKNFDWSPVPDLVAIVPESVNWLMVWSIINQYQVVDITNTALAVRQNDINISEKVLEHYTMPRVYSGLNRAIAGHSHAYPSGLARSDCAPSYSKFVDTVSSQKYILVHSREVVVCDVSNVRVKAADLVSVIN